MNVEELYARAGILLEKQGNRWRSPCPFHKEAKPSFVVYPDGSYHCFGCRAHGTYKDIKNKFSIDFYALPDLNETKDPLVTRLNDLKSKYEDALNLLIVDLDFNIRIQAIDAFDALIMDAWALSRDVETSLIDLIAFVEEGFSSIKELVDAEQYS
jgi:hypothetical protein